MAEPIDSRRHDTYDAAQPLVLGYPRASLFALDLELAQAKEPLAIVAQTKGHALGTVFSEHTAPAAFSALVEAVMHRHYVAKGIVIPGPEHLAVLGAPRSITDYLQRVTGVPLIVVQILAAAYGSAGDPPRKYGSRTTAWPRSPPWPPPP